MTVSQMEKLGRRSGFPLTTQASLTSLNLKEVEARGVEPLL